jgi:hypothetical protein
MIADISSGHGALADVLLLIAAVLFALAAIETVVRTSESFAPLCVRAGLCLLAVAWLVL